MRERREVSELRRRFRIAISHAGLDPTYSLPAHHPEQQQLPARENSDMETHVCKSVFPASSNMEGGGGGGEGKGAGMETETTEGEGYMEPIYITRQRCLVLNDWALSMFELGEYGKVRRVRYKRRTISSHAMMAIVVGVVHTVR